MGSSADPPAKPLLHFPVFENRDLMPETFEYTTFFVTEISHQFLVWRDTNELTSTTTPDLCLTSLII